MCRGRLHGQVRDVLRSYLSKEVMPCEGLEDVGEGHGAVALLDGQPKAELGRLLACCRRVGAHSFQPQRRRQGQDEIRHL